MQKTHPTLLRPVKSWFKTMQGPLRSSAIKQWNCFSDSVSSLSAAINCGFYWDTSKEGADFWAGVYYMLRWAETGNQGFFNMMPGFGEKGKDDKLEEARKFLNIKRKAAGIKQRGASKVLIIPESFFAELLAEFKYPEK